MPVKVKIPALMLKLTGQKSEITVKARTAGELIDRMDEKFPGTRDLILSPDGTINHHFLICINDEDVRFMEGLSSPLANGDRVEIVASIAGG